MSAETKEAKRHRRFDAFPDPLEPPQKLMNLSAHALEKDSLLKLTLNIVPSNDTSTPGSSPTWDPTPTSVTCTSKSPSKSTVSMKLRLLKEALERSPPDNSPKSLELRNQVWQILRNEAEDIKRREIALETLMDQAVLQHETFGDALIFRLATKLEGSIMSADVYLRVFRDALELGGGSIEHLAMLDMIAVKQNDPACASIVQPFLYFKGYKSIQGYRLAHVLWNAGRTDLAVVIQTRITEVFGLDIHPAARIGGGLMLDHGTGVVIGETSVIGKNCSFLYGVTLGGTGTSKHHDRHPKIGDNVFLGCGVTILGNIKIGDNCKIGACSLVLKPIPSGSTAVGSPAVIKFVDPRYVDNFSPTYNGDDISKAILEATWGAF